MYKAALPFLLLITACGNSQPIPESAPNHDTISHPLTNPPATTNLDTTFPEVATTTPETVDADWAIVPGKRIGQTAIGDDPEDLLQRLGRPDASDAAMGKAWLVWYGRQKNNALAVFTTYADTSLRRKAVRQIRVTSSRFQTTEGIHTGTKLYKIQTAFPDLKRSDNTQLNSAPRYDDIRKGISFEVSNINAQATCTAIVVYPAGGNPTAYLPIPESN